MEKKLGLALGGGAARGFAHVGVIRVLEGAGIPIHCVAGTSIGAIIGGMYAADKLDATEELINTLDWKKVTRFLDPLLPVSGLLGGKRLEALFASFLQDANIEDFAVPFAAVAADMFTGEEVIMTAGHAITAIRASISIPGIFTPVIWQNRCLVDGGIVNPVPVNAARQLGADVVIAVNLSGDLSNRMIVQAERPLQDSQAAELARAASQTKGNNLLNELTVSLQTWFEDKVERGRSVMEEKRTSFAEWLFKNSDTGELPHLFAVVLNSLHIMQCEITKSSFRRHPPDIILEPALADMHLLDFDKVTPCIQEGRRVAQQALPEIQRLLERA